MTLGLVWDALGDETWRAYVDLDSQEHGSLAYDRGLGKGQREPGYLSSMASAHRLVRATLGERLDLEMFEAIHRTTLAHTSFEPSFRAAPAWVGIHRDRMEPGIEAVWETHDAVPDPRADGRPRLRFEPRSADVMRARIEQGIARMYEAIEAAPSREVRILAIATFHQSLELWHPTRDGNTRRHTLVLDKLLVEHGETPVIMTEINDAYVRLPASWARMILQGMRRWRVVRDAVEGGEDVEERMHQLDRDGAIGRRGARWLRPNQTVFAPGVWEHVPFVEDDAPRGSPVAGAVSRRPRQTR